MLFIFDVMKYNIKNTLGVRHETKSHKLIKLFFYTPLLPSHEASCLTDPATK